MRSLVAISLSSSHLSLPTFWRSSCSPLLYAWKLGETSTWKEWVIAFADWISLSIQQQNSPPEKRKQLYSNPSLNNYKQQALFPAISSGQQQKWFHFLGYTIRCLCLKEIYLASELMFVSSKSSHLFRSKRFTYKFPNIIWIEKSDQSGGWSLWYSVALHRPLIWKTLLLWHLPFCRIFIQSPVVCRPSCPKVQRKGKADVEYFGFIFIFSSKFHWCAYPVLRGIRITRS